MSTFRNLHHSTTTVKEHDKMLRSLRPLCMVLALTTFTGCELYRITILGTCLV